MLQMLEKLFQNKFQKTDIDRLYTTENVFKNNFAEAYDLSGGTSINERKLNRFSATHFQNIQYERHIEKIFSENKIFGTGLDIGCGDGRGIDWLHKYGIKNKIGIDTNMDGLARYASKMSDNTYLINANPIDLLFIEDALDIVIAIEAMHYMGHNAFDGMVNKLSKAIKPQGLCVFSDHNYEAGLLYAALRGGLKDILDLTKNKCSLEEVNKGSQLKVPNISLKESDAAFSKNNFKLINRYGISALPVFLIHLFHNTENLTENDKNQLCDALDLIVQEDTCFNKIYMSLYQKKLMNV